MLLIWVDCQVWDGRVRSTIELCTALEAEVGSVWVEQGVTVDADLLLRNDVFFFLVQSLAREKRVFVYMLVYLA